MISEGSFLLLLKQREEKRSIVSKPQNNQHGYKHGGLINAIDIHVGGGIGSVVVVVPSHPFGSLTWLPRKRHLFVVWVLVELRAS